MHFVLFKVFFVEPLLLIDKMHKEKEKSTAGLKNLTEVLTFSHASIERE